MTNQKHTPTPWEVYSNVNIQSTKNKQHVGSFGITIKDSDDGLFIGKANATHIVKCVNSHDELNKKLDAQLILTDELFQKIKCIKSINDELVEALKGLLKHSEEDEYERPFQFRWITKAKRVLEKAGADV